MSEEKNRYNLIDSNRPDPNLSLVSPDFASQDESQKNSSIGRSMWQKLQDSFSSTKDSFGDRKSSPEEQLVSGEKKTNEQLIEAMSSKIIELARDARVIEWFSKGGSEILLDSSRWGSIYHYDWERGDQAVTLKPLIDSQEVELVVNRRDGYDPDRNPQIYAWRISQDRITPMYETQPAFHEMVSELFHYGNNNSSDDLEKNVERYISSRPFKDFSSEEQDEILREIDTLDGDSVTLHRIKDDLNSIRKNLSYSIDRLYDLDREFDGKNGEASFSEPWSPGEPQELDTLGISELRRKEIEHRASFALADMNDPRQYYNWLINLFEGVVSHWQNPPTSAEIIEPVKGVFPAAKWKELGNDIENIEQMLQSIDARCEIYKQEIVRLRKSLLAKWAGQGTFNRVFKRTGRANEPVSE